MEITSLKGLRTHILICLIITSAVFWVFTSTADADPLAYIASGEQKLYTENLENILDAHSIFEEAASLYPNDPVINGYLAFTRLLYYAFTYDSVGATPLMNRYGITRTGSDTDTVKYELPRDVFDKLDLPQTAPTGETVRSYLHNQLLNAVNASLYNISVTLSQWSSGDKHIAIKENTGRNLDLEIDYGDAILISSLLKALKAVLLVISAYDLDVDVREVAALDNLEAFEFGKLLDRYISFLNLLPQDSNPSVEGYLLLDQSRLSLNDAIKDYIDASDAIRNDFDLNPGAEEFAEIDECDYRVEEWMRQYLTEIKDSLDDPADPDVTIKTTREEWILNGIETVTGDSFEVYIPELLESDDTGADYNLTNNIGDGYLVVGYSGEVVCATVDGDSIYLKLESDGWPFAEIEFSGTFNPGHTQITGDYIGWNYFGPLSGSITGSQISTKENTEVVNPNPLFGKGNGPYNLRDFLPDFDECDNAVPNTVGYGLNPISPDPTLGGILPEYTQVDWDITPEVCTLDGTTISGTLSVPFHNGQGIIFIQAFQYNGWFDTAPENRLGIQTVYAKEFNEGMSYLIDYLPIGFDVFVTAWWDINSNGIQDPGELRYTSNYFTTGPSFLNLQLGSLADTDTDGMPDDWEKMYFGDLSRNGLADAEYDGVNDRDEYLNRTIPIIPDTDGDGFDDGVELAAGTDPTVKTSAPEQMVDGFYAETIDPAKWQRWEFIRRIKDGKLESAIARYDSTGSNNLFFKNPDDITSFQADVSVIDISEDDFNPKARLFGSFFNDGTPGEGQTGDIVIEFCIRDTDNDASNGLGGYYWIGRCENADCTDISIPVFETPADWYPVFPGNEVTMKLAWNSIENTFILDFGGQSLEVASPFVNAGPSSDPLKLIGTRISNIVNGQSGFIRATFDNVYRNEEFYDGFETVMIDNNNWYLWEFVRQTKNGVLESAVARHDSNGGNHLTFTSPHTIRGYQADVTVTDVQNVDAWPTARLAGAFYNDGTLGVEWTGDILAQTGIAHDGEKLISFYSVVRCLDDCNLQGNGIPLIERYDFVPVQLGETYQLSLVWNEKTGEFTFTFNGFTETVNPTAQAPMKTGPRLEFNGIGTRVGGIGGPEEWGYIAAKFDNVVVLNQVQEDDSDGDGIRDPLDNCMTIYNPDQADADEDNRGNLCDNCPAISNPDQADGDNDGFGDVCDFDKDNDRIADTGDNCPAVYNPYQEDSDVDAAANPNPDGVGDACDNCSKVSNPTQADSDEDGMGNACEPGDGFKEELIVVDTDPQQPGEPLPKQPGEPLWVTATFENNSPEPIETIKPDCFNTSFQVTDVYGKTLPPRYRIRAAYGIPKDVVTLPPGPFSVTCNLADMFPPEVLKDPIPADGEPEPYTVVATYSNDIQDPDLDPVTGACTVEPCTELFVGAVTSPPATVKIEGTSIETMAANCTIDPKKWNPQWAVAGPPTITATITIKDSDGYPIEVEEVEPSTIRLNGKVKIIPGSARIKDKKLLVDFDGSSAVRSMGTVVPGEAFTTIQGNFQTGENVFSGQGPVYVLYPIDIKPGTYPNSINLKSNGTVPVAILSTPGFDAATVDPKTVELAGAPVKMKKRNRPMASLEDVNKDGYRDLVIHIDTKELKLEKDSTVAYLTGKTFGETPADSKIIEGVDTVKIVKIKKKKK